MSRISGPHGQRRKGIQPREEYIDRSGKPWVKDKPTKEVFHTVEEASAFLFDHQGTGPARRSVAWEKVQLLAIQKPGR